MKIAEFIGVKFESFVKLAGIIGKGSTWFDCVDATYRGTNLYGDVTIVLATYVEEKAKKKKELLAILAETLEF